MNRSTTLHSASGGKTRFPTTGRQYHGVFVLHPSSYALFLPLSCMHARVAAGINLSRLFTQPVPLPPHISLALCSQLYVHLSKRPRSVPAGCSCSDTPLTTQSGSPGAPSPAPTYPAAGSARRSGPSTHGWAAPAPRPWSAPARTPSLRSSPGSRRRRRFPSRPQRTRTTRPRPRPCPRPCCLPTLRLRPPIRYNTHVY